MPSIFFLISILIFLVVVIVLAFFTKTIISKRALWYSAPLVVYMFLIYVTGYQYAEGDPNVIVLFNCLVAALKSFAFEINNSYVIDLVNADIIYAISLYIGVICSGLTLVFGALELVKAAFYNDFTRFFRLFGCKADIVLGYNDDTMKYCKNNKKAVMWIDPAIMNLTKEDKMKLYDEDIIYIYAPFNAKRLIRYSIFVLKNLFVICFQKDCEYISTILKTLEELNSSRKIIEFHVQTKSDHLAFVNEQLTRKCVGKDNIMASSFDYYELMSRKFSLDHNIARYLPNGFIKNGVVTPGRNINVVMLGYGKTAKAVLKSILINNQFVEVVNGKYQCKKINVELYDSEETVLEDKMVTHVFDFQKLCEVDYFNFDPTLGPIELTATIEPHGNCNVKSDTSNEFLASLKKSENDFTFYVIALSSSVDNTMLAESLSKTVSESSSIIFYNVDDRNEELMTESKICIPFGYKNEILSHDNITVEDLCSLAKLNNDSYNKKSGKNNDFYAIPIIEKLSNIYKEINLRFKLNLIGLDYDFSATEGLDEKEYKKRFNSKKYYKSTRKLRSENPGGDIEELKYQQYFNINLSNALIYQEHLRWAMFYFLYDYKGMKLSEIKFINGKIVHKDIPNRRHACITSFEGIDKLHRYELQMYKDNKVSKKLSDVETFQYDMKLDTAYEELTKLDYKVILLKRQ